jgi:site-specific recombinase XerD
MSSRLPKILSREEVLKLINACPDTFIGKRNRTALILAYRCGLRVSEICNLSINDVSLDTGYVMVKHGKNDADRNIPMDLGVVEALKAWLEVRKGHSRSVWFLVTRDGKKCCPRTFQYLLHDLSEKTKVFLTDGESKRPVHPHVLRHCFATDMLNEGFNIRKVQKMLGHKHLETTMIYTEVVDPELKKEFEGRKW